MLLERSRASVLEPMFNAAVVFLETLDNDREIERHMGHVWRLATYMWKPDILNNCAMWQATLDVMVI